MGFTDLPLLSQIKGRLSWLDERQRVIAENVANADTPGYVGRDLNAPTDFAAALRNGGGLQMTR
ncbi:MAG TPA: flagellar basal body protein, partial [Brevundimonas sp.]|nr:flagellar basal body protein [Brevundimonas sp.]